MKVIPPLPVRQLRAQMELKALSLKEVSRRSKVPYQVCSMLLRGTFVSHTRLALVEKAIESAKSPEAKPV